MNAHHGLFTEVFSGRFLVGALLCLDMFFGRCGSRSGPPSRCVLHRVLQGGQDSCFHQALVQLPVQFRECGKNILVVKRVEDEQRIVLDGETVDATGKDFAHLLWRSRDLVDVYRLPVVDHRESLGEQVEFLVIVLFRLFRECLQREVALVEIQASLRSRLWDIRVPKIVVDLRCLQVPRHGNSWSPGVPATTSQETSLRLPSVPI